MIVPRARVQRTPRPLHPATLLLRDVMLTRHELERLHAQRLGLNATDYRALGVLLGQGPVAPGFLADALHLTPSATSNVIERLEAAGHLTRERSTVDRRRMVIRASDSSVERAMGGFMALVLAADELVTGLPDADRQVVVDYLGALRAAMERLVADLETQPDAPPDAPLTPSGVPVAAAS